MSAKRSHLVLAYGTLAYPSVVSSIIGRRITREQILAIPPVDLVGFRMESFVYNYAVLDADGVLPCRAVGPFTERELRLIDTYEGVAEKLYRRVAVDASPLPGMTAWLYVGDRIRDAHERRISLGS